MAKMSEGQANFLEWLKTASPEEVREYLPFLRGNAEATAALADKGQDFAELAAADQQLKTAALERLAGSTATKDSGDSVTDQSLLTKLLLQKEDTGIVTIGKKDGIEKQGRAQIEGGKLTPLEYNVIRSIVSYQLDSEALTDKKISITASQIHRKMRRGKGSGKVSKAAQKKIHAAMLGLERRMQIWLNDPASAWLGVTEERRRNMRILHFDYDDGYINGQHTEYYYTIYNVGLLQEIAYKAGQLERIPQEVLAIEENTGEKWKSWLLTDQRIDLRTALEIFLYQLLRSNTTISNKKPYLDIFSFCEVGSHRETQKRAKDDIATILNYWQHLELFESWNEYGKGRGIEIHLFRNNAEDKE
ncbi:MAG: hypothetical protein H9W81_15295 [Enterococcus sp.]|nr:hypothetical protein [Enterococcus sp.]